MYDGVEHNPKLLPCSHTVCLHCLDRIVATFARDTGQFRCPICRELITIPRGGVSALPPSFLVNQLLDLMARQRREVIPKCSTHQTQVNNKIRETLRSISFVSEGEVGNINHSATFVLRLRPYLADAVRDKKRGFLSTHTPETACLPCGCFSADGATHKKECRHFEGKSNSDYPR